MLAIVQREVQSFGFNDYFTTPLSQSGEIYPKSRILDPLYWQKNQNNYNRTTVTINTYELNFNHLSSTKQEESPWDKVFFNCISDAIRRYKLVNHVDDYDTTPAKSFLAMLKSLISIAIPHISFYHDAVKVNLTFNEREFIIDYDYEDPEFIFISTFEDDRLKIKEGKITTQLYAMLESF
jgi:hypothetical protein